MDEKGSVPFHVAVILDGNGRWAEKKGKSRSFGHQAGAENVKKIVRAASDMGIRILTMYAFSTENWKRPSAEVQFLMELFGEYLIGSLEEMKQEGVQMHIIGERNMLSSGLQDKMEKCERETAGNTKIRFNIAINYGSRDELVRGCRLLAEKVKAGELEPDQISEEILQNSLFPPASRDVDLLIRTGGEQRLSNFMLWQISYAELYFTPVLWPDFDRSELIRAVQEFQKRDRRFGGLQEGI